MSQQNARETTKASSYIYHFVTIKLGRKDRLIGANMTTREEIPPQPVQLACKAESLPCFLRQSGSVLHPVQQKQRFSIFLGLWL